MGNWSIKYIIVVFLCFFFIENAFAQNIDNKEDKSTVKKAISAFNNEDFIVAKQLFLGLIEKYPNNFEFNYYVGACYLNTRYNKSKAIPYLSKAIEEGRELLPSIIHRDLGDLNHKIYSFDKALYHYKQYLKLEGYNDEFSGYCMRMIEICENAIEITKDTINLSIKNLGWPINSVNSEFAPYVSTDDSILFFTKSTFYTDEELAATKNPDTVDHIYLSVSEDGMWSKPKEIKLRGINSEHDVSIAGMSPDGEFIYINAYNQDNQDIYYARYKGKASLELELLPEPINSKYWEGKITISHDGTTIWFASDRPGGVGGADIYKSQKLTNNTWSEPINLREPINTVYDENAPFIHPAGNLFYYSSKGHNTIGGFDIFSVILNDQNNLLLPENMGFPINTTGDDTYFVLSANGNTAYFSSSYGNKYNNHDLFEIKMNLNIPLTLVKGNISLGDINELRNTKIRVVDLETGQKQKYIYNPNPVTGNFLMIFPPGKSYKMIIEAKNYVPKNIDIFVPNQQNFYELHQNIYMSPLIISGKRVGEELKVENMFFDTSSDTLPKDYTALFNAMDAIINQTDTLDQNIIEAKGFEMEIASDSSALKSYENLFESIDEAFDLGDPSILDSINAFKKVFVRFYCR
ncbi:MAG: hypothetical protein PF517_19265 [Salinivirgaceae bacterium]|jgi:tetratricopeptide (TPR) repeat protein|nr:hypothetical protein [Salinivirgaceae bacterium]